MNQDLNIDGQNHEKLQVPKMPFHPNFGQSSEIGTIQILT